MTGREDPKENDLFLLPTIPSSVRRLTIITVVFTMTHLRIF